MSFFKRYRIKKILSATMWIIVSFGAIMLLAASVKKNDIRKCEGINIKIFGATNHLFIDKEDIQKIIRNYSGRDVTNKTLKEFDLRTIERVLERDIWINNAELFFDTEGFLQVLVDEREPIARVFTKTGNTFYIDSSMMMLPLSDKFSARVPVFTNFPSDTKVLTKMDRKVLEDVRTLSTSINEDPFLMGMIDQIDIVGQQFELYPKMGDQVILFGEVENHEKKFNKLKLFYKNVIAKTGWEKYSVVNLKYDNQVVAKIKSKEEVIADSLQTLRLMKALAEYTQQRAGDTLINPSFSADVKPDESIVMESAQRDEPQDQNFFGFTENQDAKIIKTESLVNSAKLPAIKVKESKPISATSHGNVKKPNSIINNVDKKTIAKPITKPVIKPIIKPAKKVEEKAPVKKTEIKKVIQEEKQKTKPVPKAVMPKEQPVSHPNNDY
ncbi:MAG: hypothetical protein ABIP68_05100 [Ferruginibacter sp.]